MTLQPHMPDGTPAPYLMTLEELCEFLRIERVRYPREAVERLRHRGLSAIQVGKRVLYRVDDVVDFLDRQHDEAPR